MTAATKSELKQVGKTLAVVAVAAALVGVIANNALNETPRTMFLAWDYPPEELNGVIFEVVSKTNMASHWRFYANVVGTNRMPFLADKAQEFFTISRVMRRDDTNMQTVQPGF